MTRALLAALAALAAAAVTAPAAHASFRAPCVPGQRAPVCTFWDAKVRMVADGDTIKAVLSDDPSRTTQLIRFNGINAMELTHYSAIVRDVRGVCHGKEAAELVARYVKRSHRRVRLAAQHASSHTGGRHRLRRSVWVHVGGRWVDLAKLELQAGLALWLPNGGEWAHNLEYHEIADQAARAQRGLYDPDSCGAGPAQGTPVQIAVNWDANGHDDVDRNGEWVDVYNNGTRPLPLGGWWIRDSWLRYNPRHLPGFEFPRGTVVAPGGSVRLHMGRGSDSATSFHWAQPRQVFENVSHDGRHLGDGAYLFDPDGDLRAWSMYPCVASCVDPLSDQITLDVQPFAPERVEIANVSRSPADLKGHVLKLHVLGSPESFAFVYPFGAGSVLAPGEVLRIVPNGSPSNDSRLLRHLGRSGYTFSDNGGMLSLRTETDIVTACAAWGFEARRRPRPPDRGGARPPRPGSPPTRGGC